jgi:nucleotide-sensitive chloride channel 1A
MSLNYPQIVMHAISRDASSFQKPCIYLQLDDGSEDMDVAEEDEDEEQEEAHSEVRLMPSDESKSKLTSMDRKELFFPFFTNI